MKKMNRLNLLGAIILAVCFSTYKVNGQATNTFPTTGSAGIGTTTPNAKSMLDIVSTTKGVLLPRMTNAQKNAILTPPQGLLIYQTDVTKGFYVYNGTAWSAITASVAGQANKALSNLAAVAINQSLTPGTTNSIDLGSTTKTWRNFYATGNAGLGTTTPTAKLDVQEGTAAADTLSAINASVNFVGTKDIAGITSFSAPSGGYGIGVSSFGGFIGLDGEAQIAGVFGAGQGPDTLSATGTVYGVYGSADLGASSIGVYGVASNGNNQYGVYGKTLNGISDTAGAKKWAGYFVGDIAYARAFTFSDGRLKSNIQPISHALENLKKLRTATYDFKTKEYPELSLPSGKQIGFIADNVESVFPELVKDATSAQITDKNRNVVSKSVSFKAVNYTGLIPVVVEAINEQQKNMEAKDVMIDQQQKQIEKQQQQIDALTKAMLNFETALSQCCTTSSSKTSKPGEMDQARLEQNQPNPFNTASKIKFYVPSAFRSAQLIITDLSGKQLQSYPINQAGYGEVTILPNQLTAGSYIYSLIIDGAKMQTRTMELIK